MISSESLTLDIYVVGLPRAVKVQARPGEWVVLVYDKLSSFSVVGYFSDPRGSENFDKMQGSIRANWADQELSGLEVKLLGITPGEETGKAASQRIAAQMRGERHYLTVVFENFLISTKMIKVRHSRGNSLVDIDMLTGRLSVSKIPWHPPEPNESESYDPQEPSERGVYKLPEPDEIAGGRRTESQPYQRGFR